MIFKKGTVLKKSILLFAIISLFCFINNTYTQTSDWLWAKNAGGIDTDLSVSVAVDASGNVYVAGFFQSPVITFGSYTLMNEGLGDMFLAKYDAGGNVLWAKSVGGIDNDYAHSVAVDASGNAYVTGNFYSSNITFGSYTLTNAASCDMFLAKYDANGDVLWAKSAGGTDCDYAHSVVTDVSGNAYVTGSFESPTITFDSYTLTNAGSSDMFLAKYDADGNILWAKRVGGTGSDYMLSIAVDASENAYVTGYFYSPAITFGSHTLTNTGYFDIFLAKYDAGGNVLWAKSAEGTGFDYAYSVAVDASGNAYVTGHFNGTTITFGSYTLTNEGFFDIFLAKYDAGGNVLWAKSGEGLNYDYAYFVALDASGNAYVTGTFESPVLTFDSFPLTNVGNVDIFLAKYDSGGNVRWAKSVGGAGDDYAYSIAVDASGNVEVTGFFDSPNIIFGSTTLTNTVTNGSDTFLAKLSTITGINDANHSLNISMFPNPAIDKITIDISVESDKSNLTIINTQGHEFLQQEITGSTTTIDISGLKSGVYFVKLLNDRTMKVKKFVKR